MPIRRIRSTRLLKSVPLLMFLIALCVVAFYLVGYSTQLAHKHEIQQIEGGRDFNDGDLKAFLAGPAENFEERRSSTARKNLIIMSHGRSGSSLMGNIFNHHPSVFYMYEPLQTIGRVLRKLEGNKNYDQLAKEFLTGIFRCSFEQAPQILADIEQYYRKPDHPRVSQAIASPPLCRYRTTDPLWDPSFCPPMTSESLGSACKDNYDLTVIKLLINRIPEDSVRTWLNETTRQTRKDCNHAEDGEPATCTKDDAWQAANRWRWKAHPYEIDMIEHYCRGVMLLMGYRPVDRSYELLSNVKIPLFSVDYEAKHWFLH
ncbi:hypothetical protein OS493_005612 [Desmophyllum pertusum]|uniref:Sulfotransferase n=1 Tax=Desmophyllum pertusum TaxID=174260 RepID=A0A9X0CNU4_9CNID|nr:hypothetical protein OS493_005612 [Desmophyllum pertusum]